MSSNSITIGLPLVTPVAQTLLPVAQLLNSTLNIIGYFPIARTVFDGTETTFTVDTHDVEITSVTRPQGIDDGKQAAPQFMAVLYDHVTAASREWLGYPSFVSATDSGYSSMWSSSSIGAVRRVTLGALIGSLATTMDRFSSTAADNTPVAPTGTDAGLTWSASIDTNTANPQCVFFDFNWVTLFNTTLPADTVPGAITPIRIETLTNPVGGAFKASVVQGNPTVVPGGSQLFDTIRVIRLAEAAAGDYVFTFRLFLVSHGTETTKDVTFTLTIQ